MSTGLIIFGMAVFLVAGAVKGLVGIGLPTITIALTSLVLPLPQAIALITLPTVITNVWQAAVGGRFRYIMRRHWPLIVPLVIALFLTMWLIGQKGPPWASFVLGVVLAIYGAMGLARLRLRLPPDLEKPLAPVVGAASGFIAALVGVPVIPIMPYLQSLELRPAELVQTLGIVLCATALALTGSLLNFGLLDGPHALLSAAAIVPSMAGMWIGQNIRARLSVEQFRVAVFAALTLSGLYSVLSRLL